MKSEQALIDAAREGNRIAQGALVERYQERVFRLAYRITGNAHDAEDVAQEALVKALGGLATFRGDAAFGTWLYRIAYRSFLSEVRRRDAHTGEIAEHHALAPDQSEARAFMDDFDAALRQLSPAQRDAVHFSLQRGFSHPEIAHIMGLPLGTVKTHVLRGRQKLQELLSDWQEGFGNDKA